MTFKNNLIHYENDLSPSILFCKNRKNKHPEMKMDEEIPGSMILGAVEILGGSLVWILPFPGTKVVGGAMIGDGIRRAFNGLEELDKDNKENSQVEAYGFQG